MDQDDELRKCFPEYLTGTEDDQEMIVECADRCKKMIVQYETEPGCLEILERRLISVANQTPNLHAVKIYEQLLNQHFKESKGFRISKYYSEVPCLRSLMQGQINWPIIGNYPKDIHETLTKIYNFNLGRVAMHEILLLWYPTLPKLYYQVLMSLFEQQSNLRQDYRIYLAIMGVSAHGCEQLYHLLVHQFKQSDGDMAWIEGGMDATPSKLQSIVHICKILAYKPWEASITQALQALLKGQWQNQELIHGLLIFIFYSGLACFSLGNGVMRETDVQNDNSCNTSCVSIQKESDVSEQIVNLLKTEIQPCNQTQIEEVEMNESIANTVFNEMFLKYFNSVEVEDSFVKFQVLRLSEFSFQINAYPLLKELFTGSSTIHDFLKEIKTLTRSSFGMENNIETQAFRKAIRLYGENIYRYQHDDFNYSQQMNKLLPRQLKLFIKLVSSAPNRIHSQHLRDIPIQLSPDEICHITLLTMAAKIETQLIYLSRALLEFM